MSALVLWWDSLGPDSDLVDVGVVLTREKLAEIRAHNTELERATLRAKRKAGARKSADTARARRLASRAP